MLPVSKNVKNSFNSLSNCFIELILARTFTLILNLSLQYF